MIRWPWQYLREAQAQYDKAQRDDERVNAVAAKSASLKRQNGFMAAIDHAMGRSG